MGKILLKLTGLHVLLVLLLASTVLPSLASAQGAGNDDPGFSIQVTPSPLVATLEPGKQSTLNIKIRNTNTSSQSLKMGLRSFSVDSNTGEVNLSNDAPKDVQEYIRFDKPEFNLEPGEILDQKIYFNTPESAGFTYTFAITVTRQNATRPQNGTAAIEGSVAIFSLLSVNKPGASRQFELGEFSSAKRVYEFLPATFDIRLKNTGNTLVQPKGNIFIQRNSDDQEPIATLPINEAGGYILPDANRQLTSTWSDGFPAYKTVTDSNGIQHQKLSWDWSKLSQLRIGKYSAKAVAIYDNGERDVPVVAEVSFWVIPWRILGVLSIFVILLILGIYTTFSGSRKLLKVKKAKKSLPSNE
jgi:hypothetical protein